MKHFIETGRRMVCLIPALLIILIWILLFNGGYLSRFDAGQWTVLSILTVFGFIATGIFIYMQSLNNH